MESILKRTGSDGSSLLELIVATGVMTIVIVSLFHLSSTAFSSNTRSRNAAEALRLAAERLEGLRGESFATMTSGADPTLLTAEGGPNGMYRRSWVVKARETSSVPTRDITVSVGWPGGGAVTLVTTVVEPATAGPLPIEFFPPVVLKGWEQKR